MHVHARDGSHNHQSHAHSHAHVDFSSSRMTAFLGASVAATLLLVLAEFSAGYLGHSISLVSDAVHNLTDVPAMFISWLAGRWALRPPTREHTYGFHRAGILAAFTNSLFLAGVAVIILFEAIQRLRNPVDVHTGLMLGVAVFAMLVNGGITVALVSGRRDLNVRSILLHSFGDTLSNVAIIGGALAMRWTGARWVDPAIGIAIGALILWSSWGILRESSHILLEGLPRHLRLEDVARTILGVGGVQEVHDIHIWTIGTELNALSCHIQIPDMHMEESSKILEEIRKSLARDFHISHTTIQFERAGLPTESGLYMPEPPEAKQRA